MLGKNRISAIQKLHQKKFRFLQKQFLAEGSKIVPEVISSGLFSPEIIATETWINQNAALIQHCRVEIASEQEMEKISCLSSPPEVIAICSLSNESSPSFKPGEFWIMLDSIRDPGNLGTIIRLADWFGVDGIVASPDTVEWTNPKAIQATMGSFLRIQPHYLTLNNWIEQLPPNTQVWAADLDGENLYKAQFKPNGCLILSSESHGLSPHLEHLINQKLHIPAFSKNNESAESLNVAMAAAIFLGEFSRRRLE